MDSQDISEEIRSITYAFIKALIKKTGGELDVKLKFIDIYNDVCKRQTDGNNHYMVNNEIRQHVRDSLLRNNYIFVDPENVDFIFLTQKGIDKYMTL